jgi:thioredoxin reductase
MSNFKTIKSKIENNEELVGILGLGYVGLPLAVTFARKNVKVLGLEKNTENINPRGHKRSRCHGRINIHPGKKHGQKRPDQGGHSHG